MTEFEKEVIERTAANANNKELRAAAAEFMLASTMLSILIISFGRDVQLFSTRRTWWPCKN